MSINFATLVYDPCYSTFARSITILPVASQPNAGPYLARGIFNPDPVDVDTLESFYSDRRVILDILAREFPILPIQSDLINIPDEEDVPGGDFEISDTSGDNGGGEITLTLRRIEDEKILMRIFSVAGYTLGALSFANPTLTVT